MPPTVTVDGLRVTTVERTLLDLAAMGHRQLQRALNEALYKRLTDHDRLRAEAAAARKGCLVLREAIERGGRLRSKLEDDFFSMLHAAEIPLPEPNADVGHYEVDFLWRRQRVAIETDGWGAHGHDRAKRNDAAKDAYLRTLGLQVIRVSRARFEERPYAVIAEIAAALSGRRSSGPAA
jgi:hypothetical protein